MTASIKTMLLAWIAFAGATASAEEQFRLVVEVDGATAELGQVIVNLFSSKKSYMRRAAASATVAVDDAGRARAEFGPLDEGTYAVTVVYDANQNGKLDTGFLGIPKEKIGFSNNARGRFGPAKWKRTKFELSADTTMSITLLDAIKKK